MLLSLISAGHGIAGLSMQRPGLHDAFVRIVSDAKRADAEAQA
jgi:ABC-2 type transport system ATP-binding protein